MKNLHFKQKTLSLMCLQYFYYNEKHNSPMRDKYQKLSAILKF